MLISHLPVMLGMCYELASNCSTTGGKVELLDLGARANVRSGRHRQVTMSGFQYHRHPTSKPLQPGQGAGALPSVFTTVVPESAPIGFPAALMGLWHRAMAENREWGRDNGQDLFLV